ncbi:hypothetical protein ACFU6M_35415 [Streptomyces bottropensis]|uniref:hypothetical protein n=1 Tax=Streptomyces bottropensis TaxID=42235 RepID=UPI0036B5DD9D
MPLNVPVTLTLPPVDRSFTVHTDRQRWSAEQLATVPDGRDFMERAVRRGVREAALSCAYAQFTPAEVVTDPHPDGSVTMTGRVLCDEKDCHTAAQRHHFDDAESIEAKAAADWVAQKELDLAPGELDAVQKRLSTDFDRRQFRASLGFMVIGMVCVTAGGAMSQYDYTKPEDTSPGTHISVWFWQNVDSVCNHLAFPAVVAGTLLFLFGVVRLAVRNATTN